MSHNTPFFTGRCPPPWVGRDTGTGGRAQQIPGGKEMMEQGASMIAAMGNGMTSGGSLDRMGG